MDSMVAMPAPSTSLPVGRSTNINSGSSATLSRLPIPTPIPASFEYPAFRKSCGIHMDMTVGSPPRTVVVKTYCLAYNSVFSLAPRNPRSGFMKSSTRSENAIAEIAAIATL